MGLLPHEHSTIPRILTYEDLATITGLTVGTLRYLRRQGRAPKSFKIGRQVRFHERDVADWLERQSTEAKVA